jgi:hypothetical protein
MGNFPVSEDLPKGSRSLRVYYWFEVYLVLRYEIDIAREICKIIWLLHIWLVSAVLEAASYRFHWKKRSIPSLTVIFWDRTNCSYRDEKLLYVHPLDAASLAIE